MCLGYRHGPLQYRQDVPPWTLDTVARVLNGEVESRSSARKPPAGPACTGRGDTVTEAGDTVIGARHGTSDTVNLE